MPLLVTPWSMNGGAETPQMGNILRGKSRILMDGGK
jgi:hypothetical protein